MARFVEDLALALPILSGEDWKDPSVIPMPLADWRAVDVARAPSSVVHASCQKLRRLARPRKPAGRPLRYWPTWARGSKKPCRHASPRRPRSRASTGSGPESASAETWVPDGEVQLSSMEVEQHLFTWDRFRRALIGFMADYDVILTPAGRAAGHAAWNRRRLDSVHAAL